MAFSHLITTACHNLRRFRRTISITTLLAIGLLFSISGGSGETFHVVNALAFSPDGKSLAIGSYNGRDANVPMKRYQADVCRTVEIINLDGIPGDFIVDQEMRLGDQGPLNRTTPQFAFNADGTCLAVAIGDTFNIWNCEPLQIRRHIGPEDARAWGVAWNRKNDSIALAFGDSILVRDASSWRQLHQISEIFPPFFWQTAVGFSPDGSYFAFADPGEVRVWETRSWELVKQIQFSQGARIGSFAYSPGGGLLAIAASDELLVWNSKTDSIRELSSHVRNSVCHQVGFLNETTLIVAGQDGTVSVSLDGTIENHPASFHSSVPLMCVSVSPDHSRFATGDAAGRVIIWDASTMKQVRTIHARSRFRIPWTLPAALLANWVLAHWIILRRGLLTTDPMPRAVPIFPETESVKPETQ